MSNYSAIDMTTAAAQGFRDGVASVANSAIPNNQDASAALKVQPEAYQFDGQVLRDEHGNYLAEFMAYEQSFIDRLLHPQPELKAQQVGQEPAVPECVERIRTLLPRFEAGVNWTGEDAVELAEAAYDAAELLTTKPAPDQDVAGVLEWAVDRWHAEVANRPLNNVHRRALDDSWRQVIRKLGGDPGLLCGPAHDALAAHDKQSGENK